MATRLPSKIASGSSSGVWLIAGLLAATAGTLLLTGERRFDAGAECVPASLPGFAFTNTGYLPPVAPPVLDTRVPETAGKPGVPQDNRDRIAALMTPAAEATPDSVLAEMALADPDIAVREEALVQLAERGGPISVRTLEQSLQDSNPRIRRSAIHALGRQDSVASEPLLAMALDSTDPALRLEAVDALGFLGADAVRRHLPALLADQDPRVREAAAEWLDEFPLR